MDIDDWLITYMYGPRKGLIVPRTPERFRDELRGDNIGKLRGEMLAALLRDEAREAREAKSKLLLDADRAMVGNKASLYRYEK